VPIGEMEAVRGMGGIVAPLLAGFALATIAVLVTASEHPPCASWAILFLAASAVAFVYAMQFSFMALRYGAAPQERLDWTPEAAVDTTQALAELRREQAQDHALNKRYSRRAGIFYNLGLLGFLAGLGFVMVPKTWSVQSVATLGVVAVAFLAELLWILRSRGVARWLVPLREDVRDVHVSQADDTSLDAVRK
jgi:hypothetical protein